MNEIKSSINFGFYFLASSTISLLFLLSQYVHLYNWLETLEIFAISALCLFVLFMFCQTLLGATTATWCVNGLCYSTLIGAKKYLPIEFIKEIAVYNVLGCKVTHIQSEQKNVFLFSYRLTDQQTFKLRRLGYSGVL